MSGWVVDASVAVKWLVDEVDQDKADRVALEHGLIAPEIVLVEIANALAKRCRRGALISAEAQHLYVQGKRYFEKLVPVADVLPRSFELATTLDHHLYDCIYLALAERESATLVTADAGFARKCTVTPHAERICLLSEWSTA